MPESFTNLAIERDGGVATLFLDRPEKLNALHRALWHSIPEAVAALDADPDVRVIVLAGKGKAFCAGIDLMDHAQGLGGGGSLTGGEGSAVAKRRQLYDDIRAYQDTCSCFANTNKPVIAAVHGACIGAGMDLITACDIRLASAEAMFSVRETRIAMVADVGSLQRLPRVIGDGAAREWIFTGSDYGAQRAREVQLLNDVLPDPKRIDDACTRTGGGHCCELTARRAGLEARARVRLTTRGGCQPRLRRGVECRVPALRGPRRGDAGVPAAAPAGLPRAIALSLSRLAGEGFSTAPSPARRERALAPLPLPQGGRGLG